MGRVRAAARAGWVPFAVVAGGLIALQLSVVSMDRPLGWDETIYIAQADPNVADLPFVATRARGIVVLVSPLVRLGVPLEALRVVLAIASSVALAAAAACWGRVVSPHAAAAAAAVIGVSWPFLVGGSEIMPNLWSAVFLLAAGGLLAGGLASGAPRPAWWALGLVAAGAVFRPFDAAVFVLGASVAVLWTHGNVRWIAWLLGAALVGSFPWVLEMSIRYEGLPAALDVARSCGHVSGKPSTARLVRSLAIGPGGSGGIASALVVGWFVAVLGLGAWAAFGRAGRSRTAARVGLATGVALGVAYALLVAGAVPRFLMPAMALAVAAAAAQLPRVRRAGLVALTVAAVVWGGWQIAVARDVGGAERPADFTGSILAADRPCLDGAS